MSVMTASQIRQSFLDFFKSKQHTIVPSSSLMPDSPNLLFTNAGMNQFVPIFLGQIECPYSPGRAADTQKCIRAGGKHNDLDDVGLDTYHHTFFEMLGNWSFGDYFKKEAIAWAWELVIEVWKFPAERVYATIYQPDKSKNDPADRDQEAWELWAEKFRSVGLDPDIHIVNGNKKDNFWMMGDTGPCGPCTEIHIDLRPGPRETSLEEQKAGALLVNGSDARCIEIWNNVFIQYNANPDGTFSPLPAQHVDTGMGFERVCSIIQGTKGLTDFENARISNYETDVFRPIFDEIEKLSGKRYGSTLPAPGSTGDTEQEKIDVAFRVIADHIRTLSFSVADGILPGNNDRNYVLRRILRRAVRYGRTLGFTEPFFYKLVDVVAQHFGDVFPELRTRKEVVKTTLKMEEEAFNRTLDRGIRLFEEEAERLAGVPSGRVGVPPAAAGFQPGVSDAPPAAAGFQPGVSDAPPAAAGFQPGVSDAPPAGASYTRRRALPHFEKPWATYFVTVTTPDHRQLSPAARSAALSAITHFHGQRFELFAACVMPDHFHMLFQPWPKGQNEAGETEFWSLADLMHSIKSFSAKQINDIAGTTGRVWEQERFDRYVRGDKDLEEKFHYILLNPLRAGLIQEGEGYEWVWTREKAPDSAGAGAASAGAASAGAASAGAASAGAASAGAASAGAASAGAASAGAASAGATDVSGWKPATAGGTPTLPGDFAFQLYDTFGFPLDLTELMARERGLTVDKEGFETLMEEQRARARAAQKKQVIALSEIETKDATEFIGYDHLATDAKVLEVVAMKDKTAVVLDTSAAYAEMGGQLGDTGELVAGGDIFHFSNTQKVGNTFLHFLAGEDAPSVGASVRLVVDRARRRAIERHHTVTHIFHWALHEVVSKEATQKGSYVGPEKLTFDFNSAALTHAQLADIEKLVNERIVANEPVSWTEVPFAEAKANSGIMQLFGEKYGDVVRVVQIGGQPNKLDGWSMELCGGTHTRHTGEIGLFRLVGEGAIAAGVRRVEAVAGLEAYTAARGDSDLLKLLAGKVMAQGPADLEKKIEALIEQQKTLEKALKSAQQREAASKAKELLAQAENHVLVANLGDVDGDYAMAVSDALKATFDGIVVLGAAKLGTAVFHDAPDGTKVVRYPGASVALIATVSKAHQGTVQAGKIIQAIAPLVGGKGGGKPDFARGGGKDTSKLPDALAEAKRLTS